MALTSKWMLRQLAGVEGDYSYFLGKSVRERSLGRTESVTNAHRFCWSKAAVVQQVTYLLVGISVLMALGALGPALDQIPL